MEFTRTIEAIENGIRDRVHLGAQLYISRAGEVLIDSAFGEAREGAPMTRDTITLWFSAGKPLTAFAIAQLVERGAMNWNTRVAELIPDFARGGKEHITIAHLLTHTAGLDALDPIDPALVWDEKLALVCDFALPLDWTPGERAAYSATAGWYVLGEIIQRITSKAVDEFLRESLDRMEMLQTRLRLRAGEDRSENCARVYDTSATPRALEFWNSDAGFTTLVPGGSARGPVRELGKFYETLLRGGEGLVKPGTIGAMTSHQRSGMFDETFQYRTNVGYGFILNSNREGMQMPYGYGRAASRDSFGHSGNQISCAFADPECELVVAWCCNGMPGERKHQQRQRAINNAIYQDLGIS